MPIYSKHPLWVPFKMQRARARERGIGFRLSFKRWLDIWETSGHLHERGRRKGQYCMSRIGDKGPYAVGNVQIILHTANLRQPQVRAKLSKVRTGRKLSQEWRDKIGTTHAAWAKTPERHAHLAAIAKLGNAARNRKEV